MSSLMSPQRPLDSLCLINASMSLTACHRLSCQLCTLAAPTRFTAKGKAAASRQRISRRERRPNRRSRYFRRMTAVLLSLDRRKAKSVSSIRTLAGGHACLSRSRPIPFASPFVSFLSSFLVMDDADVVSVTVLLLLLSHPISL